MLGIVGDVSLVLGRGSGASFSPQAGLESRASVVAGSGSAQFRAQARQRAAHRNRQSGPVRALLVAAVLVPAFVLLTALLIHAVASEPASQASVPASACVGDGGVSASWPTGQSGDLTVWTVVCANDVRLTIAAG
jgi:hypothetical protein